MNLETDCVAVQQFITRKPGASLNQILIEVPRLAECLTTHGLVPNQPLPETLPLSINGLRTLGLNLQNSDLSEHAITDSQLRGVNFTGVRASRFAATNVIFIGCYLHGADFIESRFTNCLFLGCEISKNDFRRSYLDINLQSCDVYANWALDTFFTNPPPIDDSFGFNKLAPWEEGFCEGHQIA